MDGVFGGTLGDWTCRKKYGWLEPPGLEACGADGECDTDLFCDGGKCQWKANTRAEGQSCNRTYSCKDELSCDNGKCGPLHWPRHIGETCAVGTDCKNHDVGIGSGTQCCPPKTASLPTDRPLTCQQKQQDYLGTFWCPYEVKHKGGHRKLGQKLH